MTKILRGDKLLTYCKNRIFSNVPSCAVAGPGEVIVTPDMVDKIKLYNGHLESRVRAEAFEEHIDLLKVVQKNGRERLMYKDGVLFIPQPSGISRGERYKDMINAYIDASNCQIELEEIWFGGKPIQAFIQYDNNAYNFITGLIQRSRAHEYKQIFTNQNANDITNIIFGPLDSVAKQANKIIARRNTEYLDVQIVEMGGVRVLNLGYVYGDQAGYLIEKIAREHRGFAFEQGILRELNIFSFGRDGSLLSGTNINETTTPTAVVLLEHVMDGTHQHQHFYNMLAPPGHRSLHLDVNSVINETEEELELAKNAGCKTVDMEAFKEITAVNKENAKRHMLKINLGIENHHSDVPFDGKTIELEPDCSSGETECVRSIKEKIIEINN